MKKILRNWLIAVALSLLYSIFGISNNSSNGIYANQPVGVSASINDSIYSKTPTESDLTSSGAFFRFPWPAPDGWYFTGGPHGWGCYTGYHCPNRSGLDFAPGPSQKVLAAADGIVTYARLMGGTAGYVIKIDHLQGWQTWYLHLQEGSFQVREGECIKQGQYIAIADRSGGVDCKFANGIIIFLASVLQSVSFSRG